MRRFLTIFFCLSILALLQNVVVATPEMPRIDRVMGVGGSTPIGALEDAPSQGHDVPGSGPIFLLVAGLSGLAAVGGRSDETGPPDRVSG